MIKRLEACAAAFVQESALNHVTIETTGREIRLFDEPLMGFASAQDALFDEYLRPGVIGPHYRKPEEWLTGAKTVLSFFLPFTEEVRAANRAQQTEPGQEWLYGRIEGQRFLFALCEALRQELAQRGLADIAVPGDHHAQIRRKFIQALAARAAREGRGAASCDGNRRKLPGAFADRLEQRCALGAHGIAIGGVFHVAAGKYCSVAAQQSGTHREMGVGHIGSLLHFHSQSHQFVFCHKISRLPSSARMSVASSAYSR